MGISSGHLCIHTRPPLIFLPMTTTLPGGGAKVKRRLRPAAEAKWSFKPRLACHIHLPYVCVEGGDCKYEKHIESVVCNWHTVSWGLLLFELHIYVCVYMCKYIYIFFFIRFCEGLINAKKHPPRLWFESPFAWQLFVFLRAASKSSRYQLQIFLPLKWGGRHFFFFFF